MSDSDQISELELAHAINRVAKRLMDIGWINQAAISKTERKMHFGYSDAGLEKMETLKNLLLDEIDSALKYSEFRALIGLLLTLDQRLPALPPTPES
jgi:DNA-binding MarR family transcriptional regulator